MHTKITLAAVLLGVILCGAFLVPTLAQEKEIQNPVGVTPHDKAGSSRTFKEPGYSPYAGRRYPTRPLWGDTHVHTSNSLDARGFGVTIGPEEALRLARGEEVTSSHGEKVRLSRPLDWLVVADHSDGMGAMNEVIAGNPNLLRDPTVRKWNKAMNAGGEVAFKATMEVINALSQGNIPEVLTEPTFIQSVWDDYIAITERFNEPGRFSAIIGYEWTSTEDGNNLHRNILYRGGANTASRMLPYTAAESFNPEDLWKWMARYEEATGGHVLAIAHNGNMSNGIMFPVETNPKTGQPLTGDYAKERALREPLFEATQIKGDSETHPLLSPDDEFADFETLALGNLNLTVVKTDDMLKYEYVREALKQGMKLESDLGTNPYKFGLIGSTDTHTALSTAEEDNYFGKHSGCEPAPGRWNHPMAKFGDRQYDGWKMSASGYAAVWATENTRAAIFDAMERKEVYASTGPRMTVWFFGGYDFEAADAELRTPGRIGYTKGVSMGGDLPKAKAGQAPNFLVAALKDPIGANLDRVQIVKGWMDPDGKLHEKVYNVAWGDAERRKIDADGNIPAVGSTVNVAEATWRNTIGDSELITVWQDPEFDPAQKAFYYARVMEIPTPRWTAYDAKRFGVKLPPEVWVTLQERAYTSPIWYTPEGTKE